MMRARRFELVIAMTAIPATAASSSGTRNRRRTPAKKSAPKTAIAMMSTVPRSLPASTVPIARAETGRIGIANSQNRVRRSRLRNRMKPIQSARATLRNSEGWIVTDPMKIQWRLPPNSCPRGVKTSSCSTTPATSAGHASLRSHVTGNLLTMNMSGMPIAAKRRWLRPSLNGLPRAASDSTVVAENTMTTPNAVRRIAVGAISRNSTETGRHDRPREMRTERERDSGLLRGRAVDVIGAPLLDSLPHGLLEPVPPIAVGRELVERRRGGREEHDIAVTRDTCRELHRSCHDVLSLSVIDLEEGHVWRVSRERLAHGLPIHADRDRGRDAGSVLADELGDVDALEQAADDPHGLRE